jgi:hypothetical protein
MLGWVAQIVPNGSGFGINVSYADPETPSEHLPYVQVSVSEGSLGSVAFTGVNLGLQSVCEGDGPTAPGVLSPITVTLTEYAPYSVVDLDVTQPFFVDGTNFEGSGGGMTGTTAPVASLTTNDFHIVKQTQYPGVETCTYSLPGSGTPTPLNLFLVRYGGPFGLLNIDFVLNGGTVMPDVVAFGPVADGWRASTVRSQTTDASFTVEVATDYRANPVLLTIANLNPAQISQFTVSSPPVSGLVMQAAVFQSAVRVGAPVPTTALLTVTTEVVSRATGAVVHRAVSRSSSLTRPGEDCFLSAHPALTCALGRGGYDVRSHIAVQSKDGRYVAALLPHDDDDEPLGTHTVVVHKLSAS